MSSSGTVIFQFDGSRERFDQIYELACASARELALDIGTYYEGRDGAIEFIVDDFDVFEAKIAQASSQSGVAMRAMNYLHSEEAPNQSPQTTRALGPRV